MEIFSSLSNKKTFLTLVILSMSLALIHSHGSKYGKEINTQQEDLDKEIDFENVDRPFRMNKVNLLWTKAKKKLSDRKLADLYADLKIHDNKEAKFKKMKVDDLDEDGLQEAEVVLNYNRILKTYDLAEHFAEHKSQMDNEIPHEEDEKKSVHFQDLKLRGMWRRAQQAGFSDEDLEILKEEFWHQQMKINEFQFMSQEIGLIADPNDNIVHNENVKEPSNKLTPEEIKEKKVSMKQHNKEIKNGYLKLEHLQSTFKIKEPLFKDTRVHFLWALARKTNWSEEELEGFKEELKHFEHRLSKKTYYEEQLSLHDEVKEGKSEKIKLLEEKRNEANQKVKKLQGDLKFRLEKALRHTEL